MTKIRKKRKTTKDQNRRQLSQQLTNLQQTMIQQYEEKRLREQLKDRNKKSFRKQRMSWNEEVDSPHRDKPKHPE